jgi:hypothetical protein
LLLKSTRTFKALERDETFDGTEKLEEFTRTFGSNAFKFFLNVKTRLLNTFKIMYFKILYEIISYTIKKYLCPRLAAHSAGNDVMIFKIFSTKNGVFCSKYY